MEMFKRRKKKRRDERERQGGEGVTYLMPSWMTAFVSKHPNMHCSATRGRISLQHPISRGLLPPRRGAECARAAEEGVGECICALVCVCLHVCVRRSVRARTHICLCVFMDTDLLTTLPL